MKCFSCKAKSLRPDTTTYFARLPKCYLIIENVPCQKCSQCGEEYFSASVLEQIERIIKQVESVASKIFIMDYQSAA